MKSLLLLIFIFLVACKKEIAKPSISLKSLIIRDNHNVVLKFEINSVNGLKHIFPVDFYNFCFPVEYHYSESESKIFEKSGFYLFFYDSSDSLIYLNVGDVDRNFMILDPADSLLHKEPYDIYSEMDLAFQDSILEQKGYLLQYKADWAIDNWNIMKGFKNIENNKIIKLNNPLFSYKKPIYHYSSDYFKESWDSIEYARVAIYVDSTEVYKKLYPEDIDSIERNQKKLFFGTIISNKVKVKH